MQVRFLQIVHFLELPCNIALFVPNSALLHVHVRVVRKRDLAARPPGEFGARPPTVVNLERVHLP